MNLVAIPLFMFDVLAWTGPVLLGAGVLTFSSAFLAFRKGWEPRCARCSYELRSSPLEQPACPECGANLAKAGAVRGGTRRIGRGAASAGIVLLALSGLAYWKLDDAGRTTLRRSLIGRSSTSSLVEAILDRGEAASIARDALKARLGSSTEPRKIPSGELLDLLLASIDADSTDGGDRWAGCPVESQQVILSGLDAQEIARLEEIAIERALVTKGAHRFLLGLVARSSHYRPGSADPHDRLVERLRASPEGRALLARSPQAAELTAGRLADFSLASCIGDPRTTAEIAQTGELTLLLAEARLEPRDGGPVIPLPAAAPAARTSGERRNGGRCILLVDAPPGEYQLVVSGALVPTSRVPALRTGAPRLDFDGDFTIETALAIEGAERIDSSTPVKVAENVPPVRGVDDRPESTALVADVLAGTRLVDVGDAVRIDQQGIGERAARLLDGWARAVAGAPQPDASFVVNIRQDGRSRRLGFIGFDASSFNSGLGDLPGVGLDLSKPFELEFEPMTAWNAGSSALYDARHGRAQIWASFVLRFGSRSLAPRVETGRLPAESPQSRAREDAAAIDAVARLASSLRLKRLGSSTQYAIAAPGNATDAKRGVVDAADSPLFEGWPADLALSGWIEIRNGGRLVAERIPIAGPIFASGALAGFKIGRADLADGREWPSDDCTIQYVPDGRVAAALAWEPFDYLGRSFTLHASAKDARSAQGSPCQLVWQQPTAENGARP